MSCQDTRFKALEHTSTERTPTEKVQPSGEGSDKELRMYLLLLFFFKSVQTPSASQTTTCFFTVTVKSRRAETHARLISYLSRPPYLFDGEVVDEVVVVFVQVAVQGHAVALVEQVLQRVDALDAQRALQAVLEVGVVEDDVEAERLGAHRHRLAGAT